MLPIVLASASPRRKELLEQIGLDPIIIPADVDERIRWEDPVQAVQELACRKARFVADGFLQDGWILGADTIVVHNGKVMGKPASRQEAVFAEETKVFVHPMEMWEIEEYADTLEPMDKAGAYGIQGAFAKYIRCIQGDYNNVVGLPVSRIYQEILRAEQKQ